MEVPIRVPLGTPTDKKIKKGLTLVGGKVEGNSADILRDTGSSDVFVSEKFVKSDGRTGKTRDVVLADGTRRTCPEVWVHIDTPYISGTILALIMETPVADLVLGNQVDTTIPLEVAIYEPTVITSEDVEVIEAVQTRAGKLKDQEQEEKPSDTPGKDKDPGEDLLGNRDELRKEQQSDVSLQKIRGLIGKYGEGEHLEAGKSCFMDEDGVLYRCFAQKNGELLKQVVVPVKWRRKLLSISHDIPMSGHLGVKKTRNRLLQYFFWPGISKQVADFCKTCKPCEKSVAKGKVGIAPMVKVPVMAEPFQRIAIDCIGPLPITMGGNKYALVVCNYATRYPEAIPLRNQEAETVAEALIEIFSRVGIPQEILSDMGSNFMSTLIRELCRLMKIHKLSTTPYHPQTNGLVERFNGTLKNMLRKYAQEEQKNWDKQLPFVLFAYREVPQETTGFSPFEVLYGRHIRGPLSIVKEHWEEPHGENTSVLSCLIEV